ncbi:MAG: hypothetical protein ABH827_05540 [bacterium]
MKNIQKMLCALFMGLMFVGGNLGAMENSNNNMQDEVNLPEKRKRYDQGSDEIIEKKRRKILEESKEVKKLENNGSNLVAIQTGSIPVKTSVIGNDSVKRSEKSEKVEIVEKVEKEVAKQPSSVPSGAPEYSNIPSLNSVNSGEPKKTGESAVRDKVCCISLKTVVGMLLGIGAFLLANQSCSFSGKGICKDILRVQNQSLWKAGVFGFSSLCLAIPGIWLLSPDKFKVLSKTEAFMTFMGILGVAVPLMFFYLQK